MRALLLSGGIDSSALGYLMRPEYALVVDYGQLPASAEINAATTIARRIEAKLLVVRADCSNVGSGDLLGSNPSRHAPVPEWWPFRNQLLVTLAASSLIDRDVDELLIGTVSSDGQHGDGTQAFVSQLDKLLRLQEGSIGLAAPALGLTSLDLVIRSQIPVTMLHWTHSCHIADSACGGCRGCAKRAEVFQQLPNRS